MDDDKILLISNTEVLAMPIEENGDKLADLKSFPDLKKDNRKSNSSNPYSYLRVSVAYKLLEAQGYLPDGVHFLIIEGYRPLSLQKEYFDEYSDKLKKLHPDWQEAKIYQEASKYVSPPEIIPPHSTGGAVDLTLCDEMGDELDMGTSINTNPEESNNACFTSAENISDDAKKNRAILIAAMSRSGFVNYPTEWWHWSYGDRYWAYTTKQGKALFGSTEL
jgi:D-alanyl-D-alanine dipeptidase